MTDTPREWFDLANPPAEVLEQWAKAVRAEMLKGLTFSVDTSAFEKYVRGTDD